MSLTATDEQKEYSRGYYNGEHEGYLTALKRVESWLVFDKGMISVEALRQRIAELKEMRP